jgi:hypothetical protein
MDMDKPRWNSGAGRDPKAPGQERKPAPLTQVRENHLKMELTRQNGALLSEIWTLAYRSAISYSWIESSIFQKILVLAQITSPFPHNNSALATSRVSRLRTV